MKRVLLIFVLGLLAVSAYSQAVVKDAKPYLKNPTLPAFNIREADSVTVFNTYNIPKGRATMLVFFSPDCSHCQAFFRKLLPSIDSLKNVDFYLATQHHDFARMRKFIEEFKIADYKNIKVIGRDYEFFGVGFYGFRSVPDLVLYDSHKKLVHYFDGPATIEEIYSYSEKL